MKKLTLLLSFVLISAITYAQIDEQRNVKDFSALSIGVPADVIITKGNQFKVVLKGDEEDLKKINTKVSGDRLIIEKEDDWSFWGNLFDDEVQIYITMPSLSAISLAGSGNVKSEDRFETEEFDINISGSGKIDMEVIASETDINISGSGKIYLAGSSEEADISISGSGDIEAEDFKIAACEIKIMGSGNCTVYVTDKLDTKVMGSGDIYYKGNPAYVNNNTMGSGNVKQL